MKIFSQVALTREPIPDDEPDSIARSRNYGLPSDPVCGRLVFHPRRGACRAEADARLIALIKEHGKWLEPTAVPA